MRVRVKLDFVLMVSGNVLPLINTLDFIEAGCKSAVQGASVAAIEPGAKVSILRQADQKEKRT